MCKMPSKEADQGYQPINMLPTVELNAQLQKMALSRLNSFIFPIYTKKSGESWLLIYPWYFVIYSNTLKSYHTANCTKYHIIRTYKLFHGVI